jgi:dipeptidyl aminopeptidase/acylaminoacyl peptidase
VSKSESGAADKKTPVLNAKLSSPLLLTHGNDSTTTEFRQAIEVEKKLRASGAPVEVVDLKDEIHFSLKYDHWSKILTATKDFFDKRLK